MAKTISLPDEVYNALKNRKKKNESFAQVIQRLLGEEFISSKKKKKLLSFIGVFANDDEWDDVEKQLASNRSRIRKSKRLFNENKVD
ncbi:MAG: antitoxin VapB family protein [Promethearchaeota archaeon]